MKSILLGLAMLTSVATWSQSASNSGTPKEGTYQIIVKDTKVQWVFTQDVLEGTEEKRKQNESVSIQISPNAYLYLPSKKELKSPGFKKLDPIVYE